MTRDEILAMAKSAGIDMLFAPDHVQSFFNLAYSAGQRDMQERVANAIDDLDSPVEHGYEPRYLWSDGRNDCAAAIRSMEVE